MRQRKPKPARPVLPPADRRPTIVAETLPDSQKIVFAKGERPHPLFVDRPPRIVR